MNKKYLKIILTKFYKSIEKNKDFSFDMGYNHYSNFPLSKCDTTYEILKKFLKEKYNLIFEYVKSEYKMSCYHIYLKNDDFLIDLTASQFNNLKSIKWANFNKIILLEWENINNYYFENFDNLWYDGNFLKLDDFKSFYKKLCEDYDSILEW